MDSSGLSDFEAIEPDLPLAGFRTWEASDDFDFFPVTGVRGLSFDAIDFEEIVRGGVEERGAESEEGGNDEGWFHDSIIGFDWFVLDDAESKHRPLDLNQ